MNCILTNKDRENGFSCRSFNCVPCADFKKNKKTPNNDKKFNEILDLIEEWAEAGNIIKSNILMKKIAKILLR